MPLDTPVGMSSAVVPALGINAVDTIELQMSALDFVCDSANHAAVFVLEEASSRRRKNQQRDTTVPKDQQLHVTLKVMRKPFVVFTIHAETRTFHIKGNFCTGYSQSIGIHNT